MGDTLPAIGDHHERGKKLGHRRTDIASTEDPQRRALLARGIPARHIGDADDERAAGQADAEGRDQVHRIGVGQVSTQVAIAVSNICAEKTRRPPYCSVQIPRIRRVSEPVKIGVATRIPNSVSFRPNCCLICTPMIAKIVQTAKQTVKATVLSQRARVWSDLVVQSGEPILYHSSPAYDVPGTDPIPLSATHTED